MSIRVAWVRDRPCADLSQVYSYVQCKGKVMQLNWILPDAMYILIVDLLLAVNKQAWSFG